MADLTSAEIAHESHPHEYGEIQTLRDESLGACLDFEVETVNSRNESLLSGLQKNGFPDVLLISFMSEWCPNCHYEAPLLNALYNAWRGRGFEALLVVEYSDRAAWEDRFVNSLGIALPTVFGQLSEKDEVRKPSTAHHRIRTMMDDSRNWGLPLHLLIVGGELGAIHYVTGEFHPGALEDFLARRLA